MNFTAACALGALLSTATSAVAVSPVASNSTEGVVVVRAGTIHTVGEQGTLENGAMVVEDGRITAVGADLEVPAGARVVDFGASAVIVPGLIAADSDLATGTPPERTAAPDLRALDGFDFYANHNRALAAGVTTAYITPARGRLVAGQGALVKLTDASPEERTLKSPAAIHGAIDAQARSTPGYWKPPVPATVDVGLGVPLEQLPRSTMGAILALDELFDGMETGAVLEDYGPTATADLAELVDAGAVWRLDAVRDNELAALADFATRRELGLVIAGAGLAGRGDGDAWAKALSDANIGVIYRSPIGPASFGNDRLGLDEWPEADVPARLVAAGVPLAISNPPGAPLSDLRLSAAIASRGGLSREDALRAITAVPAAMFGVDDRVGSLAAGMDADFVVMTGDPLDVSSSVLSTWVAGDEAWNPDMSDADPVLGPGARLADDDAERERLAAGSSGRRKPKKNPPVVISADEVFLGDGDVMSPGEILIQNGRITEIGPRVARPSGARVVEAPAAMPGMIDCYGHLGLENSRRTPATDFDMSLIVEPGDRVDRNVARAGVTTVALVPRGSSSSGAPILAYKPAASEFDSAVVDSPAGLALEWTSSDKLESGDKVRDLLERAVKYKESWAEYHAEMAEWKPEPERPAFELPKSDEDEESEDDEEDEGEEEADDKKKKKKKSKEVDPDPVTGIWTADFVFGLDAAAPLGGGSARQDGDDEEQDGDEEEDEGDDEDEDGESDEEDEDAEEEDDADEEETDEGPEPDASLRMQIRLHADGTVDGVLRSDALSDDLLNVEGNYDGEDGDDQGTLSLGGELPDGDRFSIAGKLDDITVDAEEVLFEATLTLGEREIEVEAARQSRDYPMAKRPSPVDDDEEDEGDKKKEPKGKPKQPKSDAKLEPFISAMAGKTAILCTVDRADEILDCVDAFEAVGIKPVLVSARESVGVASQIAGRVRGVLLNNSALDVQGNNVGNSGLARLQAAGVPVGFHSDAEEGAALLPMMATYAVRSGMSPEGALRALTSDAAKIMAIEHRVGRLAKGLDGDVLLLGGSPLDPASSVLHVFVAGEEIR